MLPLDADSLFALLSTRPLIARRWFLSLAERMMGLQNRVADLQRSSVQRVPKQLEASELIALRYRCVDLVDRVGLEALLDEADIGSSPMPSSSSAPDSRTAQ